MDCVIRPARRDAAAGIHRVVVSALRETDAKNHSEAVIARVAESVPHAAVSDLQACRTVFVAPGCQGRGIGRTLMAAVERAAIQAGVAVLAVPSSITAEPFYAKLGFRPVRESFHGDERTIVMERPFAGSAEGRRGWKGDGLLPARSACARAVPIPYLIPTCPGCGTPIARPFMPRRCPGPRPCGTGAG